MVQSILDDGLISVVVLPTAEDDRDGGTTVRLQPPAAPGGETRDLGRWGAPPRDKRYDGELTGRRQLSRGQVRAVLDGSGEAPVGMDPESIAAARRIARHLNECHLN